MESNMSVIEITVDPTQHNHGPFPCGACAREWHAAATPAQQVVHNMLAVLTPEWDADQRIAIAIEIADAAIRANSLLARIARAVQRVSRMVYKRG